MKILKKNQLALLVISLMLITAGYLNYNTTIVKNTEEASINNVDVASIGDASLVNANIVEEEKNLTIFENGESNSEEETTAETKPEEYFKSSKLERNIMYSQMTERYQEIMNNSNSSPEQKMVAQQEIEKINNLQNAIMICENLLSSKGFKDNIIFVNGESINIILGKEELSQSEIAQIQNIISREFSSDIENIHISIK